MLRHAAILLSMYAGVVMQTSLVPQESALGSPFLPAILLVVMASTCEATAAIVWSALLGLILDGLSMERLGTQMALASILALGLQALRPLWNSRTLLAQVAMILMTCVSWRMLSPMTLAIAGGRVVDPHQVFQQAVQQAVVTAVVGSFLFLVVRGLIGRFPGRRPSIRPERSGWGSPVRC